MPVTVIGDRVMTVAEVARESGFHPETIYKALAAGELRGSKPGRSPRARWRIRRTDFDAWLEGR